jgi:2-polyprenyl-3-methyl-5-hydroxy-6-metoxy-1,4-benzoquinol methylase
MSASPPSSPDNSPHEPAALTTAGLHGEESLPLVDTPCYMCGASGGTSLLKDDPFEVLRCESCSFTYVTPRVPDSHLHLIYQTEYFKSHSAKDFGYSDYLEDKSGYLKTFRKKAELVARHVQSGACLEVGSAAGFFLQAMRERGFEVHGVEVSEYAANFAREEFGLDTVFNGKLDEADLPRDHFDVVAMWDVIEHLADPIRELQRIRQLMKKDGFLVLQTQNPEHWFARMLGEKWQHFKQLEHVYHFSPKTITEALDRGGFEVISIDNRGAGKYISVDFFIERMRRYSVLVHHLLRPFHLIGRTFFYLNPGDEMIAVARPKREEH